MINKVKAIAQGLGVNRAISYTVIGHFVSTVATPITAWLVLSYLSLEAQGYFYTFGSLLAIQSLFELGFGQCITQFLAHEFSQLEFNGDGKINGGRRPLSRLLTLTRYAVKFYTATAILAFIGLAVIGHKFFEDEASSAISWQYAWYLLCGSTSLNLLLIGATSILQGCDQVAWVARARTISNITKPIILAGALVLGFELYSAALAAIVSLAILAILVWLKWGRAIILNAGQAYEYNSISWWNDVWPFQWRIAASWAGAYLAFSLFNPIIFKFFGPEVAGRFGFTWSLLQNIAIIASVWNGTAVTKYCALISLRNWTELDVLWKKNSIVSLGISVAGCGCVLGLEIVLRAIGSPYADRMLDPMSTLLLIGAFLINNAILSMTVYLRAHKHDPMMLYSVVSGLLISGGLYVAAKNFDIRQVALANFVATIFCFLIAIKIFMKYRHFTRVI